MKRYPTPKVRETQVRWKVLQEGRHTEAILCDYLEGWDRPEGEREVQEGGDICIPMADSC